MIGTIVCFSMMFLTIFSLVTFVVLKMYLRCDSVGQTLRSTIKTELSWILKRLKLSYTRLSRELTILVHGRRTLKHFQ